MQKIQRRRFSHVYEQKVAWRDMDAFGHVNHLMYGVYFENARVDFFEKNLTFSRISAKEGPVIIHLEMDYRKQVVFPATLEVTTEIIARGRRNFEMACSMWNDEQCVVTGVGNFMWINFTSGKPADLPDTFQQL